MATVGGCIVHVISLTLGPCVSPLTNPDFFPRPALAGQLQVTELAAMLSILGLPAGRSDAAAAMKRFDDNGDGEIQFEVQPPPWELVWPLASGGS